MEKIKYYITDIPEDVDKRVQLLVLLGESNCSKDRVNRNMEWDSISYSMADERYYFDYDEEEDYHTVITYDEFMNKYKPKVNKDGEKTLEQIIEDSIKEALYWDSLDKELDSFNKDDSGKIMPSLIEPEFMIGLANVLTDGASKYGLNNWKECKDTRRYEDALYRHLLQYLRGENTDSDSGHHHMLHIACNAMFLHWFNESR